MPVFVAGIWHEVRVNLTSPPGAPLTLKAVLPGASPLGTANDYEWMYDPSNGSWSDPLYATFIRGDLSSAASTQILFVVGVDAQATPGLWSLSAVQGNTTLDSLSVEVQVPNVSAGLSVADFVFRVDPFGPADVSSQADGQYLRIANQGNVPLAVAVSFDILQNSLSLANPSATAHVGSQVLYYLRLVLGAMPPQSIQVNGLSRVTVLHVIPSSGASQLTPSIEQPFPVTVDVTRSGYALKVVGNVVFQTLSTVTATYGALTTWQVYLTGSQNVSFDIASSGAHLIGAYGGGNPLALPAVLVLSADREYPVTVEVEANQPSSGTATFTLHLLATGDVQTFVTTIVVNGGPPSVSNPTITYLWIAGSVAAAVVFGLVGVGQWRNRTRRTFRRGTSAEPLEKAKRGYNYRRRMRNQRERNRANERGTKGAKGPSRKPGTIRGR